MPASQLIAKATRDQPPNVAAGTRVRTTFRCRLGLPVEICTECSHGDDGRCVSDEPDTTDGPRGVDLDSSYFLG